MDGGASGSGTRMAALGLRDGGALGARAWGRGRRRLGSGTSAHSALGLGDDDARARGRRRRRLGSGTAAHSALGLGDGGTRARGRGRRCSGSGMGTAALRLGDGDGGSLAAQLCQLGRDELGFLPEPTSLLYCKQSQADI
jgi:hypothetical protein